MTEITNEMIQQACVAYGGNAFPRKMKRAIETVLEMAESKEVIQKIGESGDSEKDEVREAAEAVVKNARYSGNTGWLLIGLSQFNRLAVVLQRTKT